MYEGTRYLLNLLESEFNFFMRPSELPILLREIQSHRIELGLS